MKKKQQALLGIICYYLIAMLIALIVYRVLPFENMILRVFIANISATFIIYLFSLIHKNSSIYDPYWSVAPLVLIFPFVDGLTLRTLLMIIPLYYWGVRLTLNWVYTFHDFSHQDWRYDYYKQKTKLYWPIVNLMGIHVMPTVVVFLAMIPVFRYLQSDSPYNLLTVLGAGVVIFATSFQWLADVQMHRFKKTPSDAVMNQGLWAYSRHPNYLGEMLVWLGFFVMMISVIPEWHAIFGLIVMMLMFSMISIPLMEKRQLEKRPNYEEYQSQTNVLLPVSFERLLKLLTKKS